MEVPDQRLVVVGMSFPVPALCLSDDPAIAAPGYIGIDVLRGSVLVLGRPGEPVVRWLVPPGR